MFQAIILNLLCWVFALPAKLLNIFVFKRVLPKREGILYGALIALALLIVPIGFTIFNCVNSGQSVISAMLTWAVVFLLIASLNASALIFGKANSNIDCFEQYAKEHDDFFDENAYNENLPKCSLKTLYKRASKEGFQTVDYVKRYVPPKILDRCEELRGQSDELKKFLTLCVVKRVFNETYLDILYNDYMKPPKKAL